MSWALAEEVTELSQFNQVTCGVIVPVGFVKLLGIVRPYATLQADADRGLLIGVPV